MREAFRPDRPSVAELAAGGVLERADGRILLIHDPTEDRWCFPKGHVETGESLEAAARREITEETGVESLTIVDELVEVHYRFFQPARDRNVLKSVVYFRVRPGDDAVRLEGGFDAHRWVTPEEARRLVPYPADRLVLDALGSS